MNTQEPTAQPLTQRAMTRTELLALPTSVDLTTANRALDIGRSTGYALVRQGEYPCKVLRAGKRLRVVTADLWAVLGVADDRAHAA
ncbi:hypothetical protein [Embleya sp. NPDC001921]